MKIFNLILFVLISAFAIKAQSIPDSEFTWYPNPNCVFDQMDSPIFAKVEIDPLLTRLGKAEYENFCKKIVDNIGGQELLNGVIKIKVLFHKDHFVLAREIGVLDLELSDSQQSIIIKAFSEITDFTPGKQRDIPVNALGICYLYLTDSRLDHYRCVNFDIRNDL